MLLCPERRLVQDCPRHSRSPSAAPPRPAPSLSERRAFPLAGSLTQEEAMPSCASTRGPQPACIRHHRCRCSCPAHYAHESDSSQPSFVCHHPWDTIMSQAETIALAGLVKSLHPGTPVPGAGGTTEAAHGKIARSFGPLRFHHGQLHWPRRPHEMMRTPLAKPSRAHSSINFWQRAAAPAAIAVCG